MDWTTSDCRVFHRLMSRHALLYTEMVTTGALLHNDPARFLDYHASEQPIALQLGVKICLGEMQAATNIPVTVKHRLGIDDLDSFELLHQFVDRVKESGCSTFIIHARKAILQGLSPKQNREVPPLIYDYVYRIKALYPDLEIVINGGIKTIEDCESHLQEVDGVMIGREAYQNPYGLLSQVDAALFGVAQAPLSRLEVAEHYIPYLEQQLRRGRPLYSVIKHLLGLFHGQRGGKQFRRFLSENGHKSDAGVDIFRQALTLVDNQNQVKLSA